MIKPRESSLNRPLLWLVLLLLTAVTIEAGSALFLWFITKSSARFLVWAPDFDELAKSWAASAGQWDDELGWPSPRQATAPPRDRTGAKLNADFPEPGGACLSAYGDSFVWGEEVPLSDGWIEQLSRQLGCRVANYGVSGYGTDQALVRFRNTVHDEAPVVLLGIFPENVTRNVNQYRAFIGHAQSPLSLKGRFILAAEGGLVWIARPRLDREGFIALNRDPAKVIPQDYLLPDTRDGPVTVRFPYTLAVMRVASMPRVLTRLTGKPSWSGFFETDHPSGALALTVAIGEAFARQAIRRGKRPLIVMMPGASSFRARATYGAFEYAPLVETLSGKGVDVFDPGPALLAALGSRSFCELYVAPADCNGHFGTAGGTLVAEVLAGELRRRGWVK